MFTIAKNVFIIVLLQLTEKAGFIIREYVKYSLYDRISTRPFLTDIEKRWIAFQVLYALHQCHKVGVSDMFVVSVIIHVCLISLLVCWTWLCLYCSDVNEDSSRIFSDSVSVGLG
jgi:hypothetical protein